METAEANLKLLHMLAARLERLSADSAWAHRASGVRGHLLRLIDEMEAGAETPDGTDQLIDMAFEMLLAAAKEIPIK